MKCIANCSILLTTNTFALDGSKSRQYFINSPQQTKGEMGLQMHARAFLHPLSLYTVSLIRILEGKCFFVYFALELLLQQTAWQWKFWLLPS